MKVCRARRGRGHGRHAAAENPQLLDHRPHRPRQDDPLRPPARADGGAQPAGDDRAVPRLDGPRARAGHHDQAALRAPRVQGEGRARLHPQPHRHSRPRGLRVRGVPLAGGLPGGAPRGGREPGRRGPDARQRPPRLGRGARDHPGPQQDRPARGRARARQGADRARHRDRRVGGDPGLGQDGGRGSTRSWRRSSGGSRRPRATPTGPSAASSSTPGSTSTAASWSSSTWWTAGWSPA